MKRKSFKTQYLKKSGVNSRTYAGRSIIVETSFEETAKEYRFVKTRKINIDHLSLKSEIEYCTRNRYRAKRKDDDLVAEAQDMLMDVTQTIEEATVTFLT